MEAYDRTFSLQSNFARSRAGEVATSASLGLITNLLPDNTPTNEWRITQKGLRVLALMLKEQQ